MTTAGELIELSGPPEALSPATAYGLAWNGQSSKIAVLATLLDLVDRGWFCIETEESELRPDRFDLIFSVPARPDEPTGLEPHEEAVLAFFDRLIGRDPGPLRTLGTRMPAGSVDWLDRWTALQSQLEAAADQEVRWRHGLRRLGMLAPETIERQLTWLAFAGWTQAPPSEHDHELLELQTWIPIVRYAVVFGTVRGLIDSGRIPASVMSDAEGRCWWACHGRARPLGLWHDDAEFAAAILPPARSLLAKLAPPLLAQKAGHRDHPRGANQTGGGAW